MDPPAQSKPPTRPSEAGEKVRCGRPRLVRAELVQERGARVRVLVSLELGGNERTVERVGVGDEALLLRLAAEATLAAIHEGLERPGYFELVGVKRIHAFDEDVILTCVQLGGEPGRRLLGCVPVARRSLVEGAAASLLNATNRLVEWLPGDSSGSGGRPR